MSETVLVVGGGLVGSLIALRLSQAGCEVTVFDADRGRGASPAAAGILAGQCEAHGEGAAFDLGLEGRALHAALHHELTRYAPAGSGYRVHGALEATTEPEHEARAAAHAWQRARGLRVESLDARALRELAPGLHPRFTTGVLFPDDASVEPQVLVESVAAALVARRVPVVDEDVVAVTVEGGRVRGVRTAAGLREAGVVVLCGGAWTSLVGGGLSRPDGVAPARGQLVELMAPRPLFTPVVYAAGGYLLPRADGRVCVGSTLEMVGFTPGTTPEGLATLTRRAAEVAPALAESPLVRAWSGFRPRSPDGLPLVGALDPAGLFVATGHHRSGILLAPVTADIVRDLIVDGRRHRLLEALSPARFDAAVAP